MSFRITRCDSRSTQVRGARHRPAANAGFTLIEVLVAIALIAVGLAAIGAVAGNTSMGIRTVDRKLQLLETAQNLLVDLTDPGTLQLGSQSGASGDLRWRIDVVPLAVPAPPSLSSAGRAAEAPKPALIPVAITVRVQGTEGAPLRLDTVRLLPARPG
jgi:general secretion pathway protein I